MQAVTVEPINAVTCKPYSGGNVQRLIDAMDSDNRFISGAFATFRQWLSIGRAVRKGETCAARLLAFSDGKQKEGEAPDTKRKAQFKKGFCVFALEQTDAIEGWTPDQTPVASDEEDHWTQQLPVAVTERQPSKPAPSFNVVAIRAKVERLRSAAESCHADRLSNTAKRLGQAMSKRMEGDRYKRQADMLDAACVAIEAGKLEAFASLSTQAFIHAAGEASRFESRPVSNGYHSYSVETDKPMHADAIHNALRRLVDPNVAKGDAERAAKIQADADLRNCEFEGFFPTPPAVVAIMLEQAGDIWDKSVLEPSAGKGDLVAAALKAGAISVKAFEVVPKLADYLAKFIRPVGRQCVVSQQADFMNELPACDAARVDVVLMNPPFEKDAAPKHVLHALSWLKPGGRLVSVMPANWQEKKAADYLLRTINDLGLSMMDIEVDGGAFSGADSFRQTAVRTSILVIG